MAAQRRLLMGPNEKLLKNAKEYGKAHQQFVLIFCGRAKKKL